MGYRERGAPEPLGGHFLPTTGGRTGHSEKNTLRDAGGVRTGSRVRCIIVVLDHDLIMLGRAPACVHEEFVVIYGLFW